MRNYELNDRQLNHSLKVASQVPYNSVSPFMRLANREREIGYGTDCLGKIAIVDELTSGRFPVSYLPNIESKFAHYSGIIECEWIIDPFLGLDRAVSITAIKENGELIIPTIARNTHVKFTLEGGNIRVRKVISNGIFGYKKSSISYLFDTNYQVDHPPFDYAVTTDFTPFYYTVDQSGNVIRASYLQDERRFVTLVNSSSELDLDVYLRSTHGLREADLVEYFEEGLQIKRIYH